MKKLLNNPWVVGVLALAAVAFVAHSLIPAGGSPGVSEVAEDAGNGELPGGESSGTTADAGSVRDAIKELSGNPAATRDPFSSRAKAVAVSATPAEKVPAPDVVETVRLTALWTQNGGTYALINERICRVGDKLGRITIETATQDGVWVTHWKGRDFIALGAAFTLTTPALKAAALSLSTDS
ncbi:hypothetical protein CMV30_16965 [Nibricoccus aquaticus]|uniref:Uncharacterized protein n=1 Tax=Nibricoccus aquaticus TaxID=2576891 RepID=A0A290QE48_9BACT|nr:hypothetical protein [Nibricoccus aquaticus]ATC65500.1 hypothetical protein CMV30_16965 [Nibricoccus aquaticus]